MILHVLDVRAFLLCHLAIGHRLVLGFLHARLALVEAGLLLVGQLASLRPFLDALLLVLLPLVDARSRSGVRRLRRRNAGQPRDDEHDQGGTPFHIGFSSGGYDVGLPHPDENAPARPLLTAQLVTRCKRPGTAVAGRRRPATRQSRAAHAATPARAGIRASGPR